MQIPLPELRPVGPIPSPAQLAWQHAEIGLFVHFTVNTYTGREWGDGTESPEIFQPASLDTDQWAAAAKDVGAGHMVLTAKHHDGFCLWPSAHTNHSVRSSSWRQGRGDVVAEFVRAARSANIATGFYLSPWDRHEPTYGDSPAYNRYYLAQLRELLSTYAGPDTREIWFDGAIDSESRRRGQTYDFPAIFAAAHQLAPNAVRFGDGGTDVRWVGNELGVANERNWSQVIDGVIRYPGDTGVDQGLDAATLWARNEKQLQSGDPDGNVWRPAESDVSIRPGWFHHAHEDDQVRSPENLLDLYFKSVGRNSFLLLNIPPTPAGLFHDRDVATLRAFARVRDRLFATDLAAGAVATVTLPPADAPNNWSATTTLDLRLPRPTTFDVIDLREPIHLGQRVANHKILARNANTPWQWVIEGQTIGRRRLHRLATPITATELRVILHPRKDAAPAVVNEVGLYA